MKIIYAKNYEDMSKKACEILVEQIKDKKDSVLGLATGSTPLGLYKEMIEEYENGLDFSEVSSFNLDEYIGLSKDNDQSYNYFMNKNLFDHINIKKENINIPDGSAKPELEIKRYEDELRKTGGVDIQILGLGSNGHIAFNEPASELNAKTSIIQLTDSTIKANARFFERESDVPTEAITMGMGSIFTAKKIIILISGKNKEEATKYLVENDKISTDCPVSLLHLHQDTVVIIDEEMVKVK